jgi:hypothetical protein
MGMLLFLSSQAQIYCGNTLLHTCAGNDGIGIGGTESFGGQFQPPFTNR